MSRDSLCLEGVCVDDLLRFNKVLFVYYLFQKISCIQANENPSSSSFAKLTALIRHKIRPFFNFFPVSTGGSFSNLHNVHPESHAIRFRLSGIV